MVERQLTNDATDEPEKEFFDQMNLPRSKTLTESRNRGDSFDVLTAENAQDDCNLSDVDPHDDEWSGSQVITPASANNQSKKSLTEAITEVME